MKILIITFLLFFVFAGATFIIFSEERKIEIKPDIIPKIASSAPEEVQESVPTSDVGALKDEAKPRHLSALPVLPVLGKQEILPEPPEIIRALYFTSASAGSKKSMDYLIGLASSTEINAAVIDVKDFSGNVRLPSSATIKKLHDAGIYLIARIAVFQDPIYAKARPESALYSSSTSDVWLDKSGLAWIDPAAKEYWEYIADLAKNASQGGFDEINFDYIRFPSDGDLEDMVFPFWDGKTPRKKIIKEFYQHLREQLPETKLSVDLFGYSTTNFDDLGVGHVLEDAFEYFDYISPMVYPSHYSLGFQGFEDPNEYPYEVVKYSMGVAVERLLSFRESRIQNPKLRPWLQHFNLGVEYDAEKIKLEIQAVKDALLEDYSGYMLWSPSNIYIEEALVEVLEEGEALEDM